MIPLFVYRAWPKRLVWSRGSLESVDAVNDGDSLWLLLDLGAHTYRAENCRLFAVNAQEKNSQDPARRALAFQAKEFLSSMVAGTELFVESRSLDKYGRPLVVLWHSLADVGHYGLSLNKRLVDSGLAVPYMDGGLFSL